MICFKTLRKRIIIKCYFENHALEGIQYVKFKIVKKITLKELDCDMTTVKSFQRTSVFRVTLGNSFKYEK